MTVLGVSSAVAFGHVGLDAARLPLAWSGLDLAGAPTVLFSNHPGHGRFRGRALRPAEVEELAQGALDATPPGTLRAVMTGYLGDPDTAAVAAAAIDRARAEHPGVLVLVDPVMGDAGRVFVRDGVPEAIRAHLLPRADWITPNRFELALLAGRAAATRAEAAVDAAALAPGALVTSWDGDDVAPDAIETLAVVRGGAAARIAAPRLPRRFDGAGDCLAALFVAELLAGGAPEAAAARAVGRLQPILAATLAAGGRDLALTGPEWPAVPLAASPV